MAVNNSTETVSNTYLLTGGNGYLGTYVRKHLDAFGFKVAVLKSIVITEDMAKLIPPTIGMTGTFNLTYGCHRSFQELATLIPKHLNKPRPLSIPNWCSKGLISLQRI